MKIHLIITNPEGDIALYRGKDLPALIQLVWISECDPDGEEPESAAPTTLEELKDAVAERETDLIYECIDTGELV